MRFKSIYCFFAIFLIIIVCTTSGISGDAMNVSKEEAIEIANKEVEILGYNIHSMDIQIDKYNTPWNEYIPRYSELIYDVERRNKLADKEYWAVYYGPKQEKNRIIKGGDICIFVDASNGKIITNVMWK